MKRPEVLEEKCKCGHPRRDHCGLTGDCCGVSLFHAPHVCQCQGFEAQP
jgi:hypothetical protein